MPDVDPLTCACPECVAQPNEPCSGLRIGCYHASRIEGAAFLSGVHLPEPSLALVDEAFEKWADEHL